MGLKASTVSRTSTAHDIIRATCRFEAERDVSSTETNIAAFRDTDPLKAVKRGKNETFRFESLGRSMFIKLSLMANIDSK